jgi:hypothetical protein
MLYSALSFWLPAACSTVVMILAFAASYLGFHETASVLRAIAAVLALSAVIMALVTFIFGPFWRRGRNVASPAEYPPEIQMFLRIHGRFMRATMMGVAWVACAMLVGVAYGIAHALGLSVLANVLYLICVLLALLTPVVFLVSLISGIPRST